MTASVEVPLEKNITEKRFWELAQDLLYTKVYYNKAEDKYVNKVFKAPKIEDDGIEVIPDDLPEIPPCTEDEINTLLVSYLTLVTNYCDQLAGPGKDPKFFEKASRYLLEYKNYKLNQVFCIRKMLSLLWYAVKSNENNIGIDLKSLNEELATRVSEDIERNECLIKVIGWIFYTSLKLLLDKFITELRNYRGIEAICSALENYEHISQKSKTDSFFTEAYSPYMRLLYGICQNLELDSGQLDSISEKLIRFMLDNLKVTTEDEDPLNFLTFKILLALNEQFMVRQYAQPTRELRQKVGNRFFNIVLSDANSFHNFLDVLVLNFNRETNTTVQILMLKVLYVVFTTSSTCQQLYLNDLKVILDIFIRELCNLSLVNDEVLINTYLRVLYPMLLFSNIKGHSYKVDSLRDILAYLSTTEQTNDTTVRLSKRCLSLDYFNSCESQSDKNNNDNEEDDDNDNVSVLTTKSASPVTTTHPFASLNRSTGDINSVVSLPSSLKSSPDRHRAMTCIQRTLRPPPPPRSRHSSTLPRPRAATTSVASNMAQNTRSMSSLSNKCRFKRPPPRPPLSRSAESTSSDPGAKAKSMTSLSYDRERYE